MPDSSAPPVAPPLTKIVATLGPASDDEATITRLIEAGVGVFRLNFSHGDLDGHARRIERVRAAARSASRPIAILGDLQGPRIRTGPAPDDGVEVVPGVEVHIRAMTGAVDTDRAQAALPGEPLRISATYADLVHDVEPGHGVLVADGSIRMLAVGRVEGADGTAVLACTVTQGASSPRRRASTAPTAISGWRR